MARSNTYSVEAPTKFLNNLNATSTTIPNFGHQRRFASQKQTSRKGVFNTNTLPHRMKRELRNNCSIRQQADVIRYISTKTAAESEENSPPADKLYLQNVFSPDVHSTPIYQIRNKAHSIPKNASMSTSFNTKQSGVCQSNHYLNDYELFKSSTAHQDTVPTVSKKIDIESHHITTFNIGTSTIGSESKIIKRRGIRGVSWILRLALKDTSIGRIYRTQIGWVILILVIFILIAGLLVHFSGSFTTFHMISFTNLTNIPPKFILDIVNSTNETSTERSTTYHPYSAEMNDAIMSNNLYEQNDVPSTSVEVFTYEVENQTTFSVVENNKTDNIIRDGNSKYKSKMADFTNQLMDYCKGCRKILDVCIAVADSGIPMCRPAADIGDPTGCGGLCALEIEACHLLDHKHSIYTCRPLETLQLCKSDEWRCKNHLCVPGVKRCDGHINCYDRSDETDCTCNLAKNFHCGNNTSCLENKRRCDGVVDCWDGSDELNCTAACPEDQFACTNGECIQRTLFCDGLADCRDGSDEPIGCGGSCRRHEFKCSNKRCIPKWRVCNGTDNCGDMSDELSCPHVKLPS